MRLYYKTSPDNAKNILEKGFSADVGQVALTELTGIWLSDILLNSGEMSEKAVLVIDLDITEDELDVYEVKEGSPVYKEYILPVKTIEDKGKMQIIQDKAEKELAYLDYLDSLEED